MLAFAQSCACRGAPRVWLSRGLAAASLVLGVGVAASAQLTLTVGGSAAAASEKPKSAFSLPTQSSEAKTALEEFQRMVTHEQWEKAFGSLETISKSTATGFIDRGDGVLVPASLLVRSLLAELPSAGKNAYRLFYDSQATQLRDQAAGKAEAENLSTIVANHLISSVGDAAADRLGDLHFERGDFEQAAAAWQALLTYCPDSKIPKPLTMAKLATALARSKRWTEFGQIEHLLRERHASEEIEIGGRRVVAVDHVAHLASAADTSSPVADASLPSDVALPAHNQPAWRFRFHSKDDPQQSGNPFQLRDVYGQMRANSFVIPAAADERRVYANVFGVEMAFDLATGKLLWRSGKLHLLNLQQAQQNAAPERYSIDVHGDRTWSVSRDPQQANQQGPFTLTVRDSATGKETFSSRRSLGSWTILGAPFVAGDTAYVGAQQNRQGRELAILMLDAKSGKLLKTVKIGNYAADMNQTYNQTASRPTFALSGDRLYVDTHAGALVALNPQSGAINWAVMYESPVPQTGYYYGAQPRQTDVSGPLVVGGLIFAKGLRSPRLVGIASDGPRLVWNRPAADAAVIVAADDERIYLGGEELTAYSLKTQELEWATQLPRSAEWCRALVTARHIYQFTSRGVCEVDKQSGEIVRIFRGDDLDSLGGALFVAPGKLVTVSNLGITAYDLDPEPSEARN